PEKHQRSSRIGNRSYCGGGVQSHIVENPLVVSRAAGCTQSKSYRFPDKRTAGGREKRCRKIAECTVCDHASRESAFSNRNTVCKDIDRVKASVESQSLSVVAIPKRNRKHV